VEKPVRFAAQCYSCQMYRASLQSRSFFLMVIASVLVLAGIGFAHAQTQSATDTQLRATIQTEVMADPRSQTISQAQLSALVDSLTAQAEAQGLTSSDLTYRPSASAGSEIQAPTSFSQCSTFSCTVSRAFGLDGSIPIIPIAFFVAAALFILIYGIMREMGHPHTKTY
jgi:hypothetical protein